MSAVSTAHAPAATRRDIDATLQRSLVVGVVALGLCGLGGIASPQQFFRSYLLAYVFWVSVALGCLPITMLHHLTGGAWGLVIRRILEAATRTLPWMAILFVPIAFGLGDLYLWAQPAVVARDELLQHKAAYLNVPFFLGRTVLYFVAWIGLTYALNRWSLEQDRTADVGLSRRMQLFSGPGIGVYGLTVTFASFDWLMSLDPHWYSTLFGAWFVAGQGLSALAFAIAALYWLSDRQPLAEVVTTGIFHDLGKLLLAFVMVWAYLSFSQFLIIFSANLPEEITYYLDRSRGGWQWVAAALVLLHFVVPFVLLLSRQMKRNPGLLAIVAAGVFLMRFVDMTWLVVPNFTHAEMRIHWMDLLAPVGLGGIWLGLCLRQVKTRPLLPLHDPYMDEALGRGTH